ncbi:MAG: hypothetical protein ACI89D_002057 [Bermanella sp.]|jgi:hypothetical protein
MTAFLGFFAAYKIANIEDFIAANLQAVAADT